MKRLPKDAIEIIRTLKKAGFTAYAVGGSVRDIIMDRPTRGWDFASSATPEQILALFTDSFYDNQFGTVGVKIKEKGLSAQAGKRKKEKEEAKTTDVYEITTFRSERGYADHRHPDTVSWGKTIEEDLSRRDFTINAIAYDGTDFVDPYDGRKDLENKAIRAVGNADDRFAEDALRMMRAVRIAAELGFTIEDTTRDAIIKNAQLLSEISKERIRDEFMKLMGAVFAADGILILKNTGILAFILPEFEPAFETPQKSPKRHHIYDVGTHSVMALKNAPTTDPIVRFATLIHDIGKPKTYRKDDYGLITFYNHEVVGARIARVITERLRFSKKQTEKIITLIRWHQFSVDERQTDTAIRRFIRRVGKENLDEMLALRIGDRLGGGARETSWRLELFKNRLIDVQKQPFTVADLTIDGHDVMKEYACQPGPLVGKVLNALFAEVEKGTLANEREALILRMKELKNVEIGK